MSVIFYAFFFAVLYCIIYDTAQTENDDLFTGCCWAVGAENPWGNPKLHWLRLFFLLLPHPLFPFYFCCILGFKWMNWDSDSASFWKALSVCIVFVVCWVVQVGLLTPLTFAWHCLSPLAAFTSGAHLLHNGRRWQWICKFYTDNFKDVFEGP